MATPSLLDGKYMTKKVIKASEADGKVKELTESKEKKVRSTKEKREAMFGKDEK